MIVTEKVLFAGKGRHRHVAGYQLDFSTALDPVRATSLADYELTQTLRHGRKLIAQPVAFRAAYDATARSVTLTLAGRPKFTKGGRLVVVAAAPGGVAERRGGGTGRGRPRRAGRRRDLRHRAEGRRHLAMSGPRRESSNAPGRSHTGVTHRRVAAACRLTTYIATREDEK